MGCILRPGKREWKGGILPYNIRTSDFNAVTIRRINEAIRYWNTKTNWEIRPRKNEKDYVIFKKGEGCSSPIGRRGGSQGINIGPGCSAGSIIHEIAHTIGFAHEQSRSDRDNFVAVIESRIDSNRIHNFRKVRSSEYVDYGDYDHRSIMHYPRNAFLKDKKYDWSSWYNNVEILNVPGHPSLFLLKSSTGEAHNMRLESNFIAQEMSRHDWSSNWTSTKFYSIGNKHFLFLLKKSDGIVHINEVSGIGQIGRKIKSYDWTSGWTSVDFYKVFNKTYLILWKVSDGQCHMHQMNSNGTVGGRVGTYKFRSGFTHVKTFNVGNKVFLFRMKKSSGDVEINEISPAGTMGISLQRYKWPSWDVQEFYTINGQTYLFLLRSSSGVVNVRRMNSDGRVGSVIQRFDWNSQWTHARVFFSDGNYYLYLHKAHNGEAQIRSVSRAGRIGNRTKMNPGVTLFASKAIGGGSQMTGQDISAANARI